MKKGTAKQASVCLKEEADADFGSKLKGGTSNAERRTPNVELKRGNAETGGGVRFDLEERLLDYAVRIIRLVDALPATKAGRHVADQLLRCGTSPLANHGELQGAESRRDFIHKLGICLKEIREAQRWLRLIHRVPLLAPAKISPLLTETDALIRIFVRSVRTAEKNR
ncbi:MAG: four helix bundle protein [Chthoniobacterales bacterium]|nr:four helix bundle protein [Chthoniobacterales bacterium]